MSERLQFRKRQSLETGSPQQYGEESVESVKDFILVDSSRVHAGLSGAICVLEKKEEQFELGGTEWMGNNGVRTVHQGGTTVTALMHGGPSHRRNMRKRTQQHIAVLQGRVVVLLGRDGERIELNPDQYLIIEPTCANQIFCTEPGTVALLIVCHTYVDDEYVQLHPSTPWQEYSTLIPELRANVFHWSLKQGGRSSR